MRLLFLLLALALLPADADAQRWGQTLAREGDLALTIGLVGLDDVALRPLDGGIGLRYRTTDRTVLGASVGLSLNDGARDSQNGDTQDESESDFLGTSLSVWAERHIGGSRVASPFVGLAARVRLTRSDARSESIFPCEEITDCPDPIVRTIERESVVVGGGLLIGAEVKLARGVTLGGAYTLGAEFSKSDESYVFSGPDGTQVSAGESSGWRYGVGTTQVGLSVYF